MKQCINKECNAFIEDNNAFCQICGTPQLLKKLEKRGFFGRKKQEAVQAEIVKPEEFEDFKLSIPQISQQPKISKETMMLETMHRIEQKLDMILSNNEWLLANVDNWIEGYKKAQEKESEKNK